MTFYISYVTKSMTRTSTNYKLLLTSVWNQRLQEKKKKGIKLNKNNENKLTECIVSWIWVQPGLFCFSSDCHHLFSNTVPALSGQLWAQLQICLSSHLPLRYGNLGPLNLKQMRAKGRRFKPFYPQSDSASLPLMGSDSKPATIMSCQIRFIQ